MWPLDNMSGLESWSCRPESETYRDFLPLHIVDVDQDLEA
jgi:hypothetical protein